VDGVIQLLKIRARRGWLLLKCFTVEKGFNTAETNCGIAHILGIHTIKN